VQASEPCKALDIMGRTILTVSAAVLFVLGGSGLFAASETASWLGAPDPGATSVIVQIAASAALGLAIMNWFSRGSRRGGIYARPLCLANLLFFGSSALCIGKAVTAEHLPAGWIALTAGFACLGLAFAWLAFFHDPLAEPAARS
jgi:hypothetical protein